MRIIASIILIFIFSKTTYSQEIELGKYRLCYDMYWRCHFQNLIELRADSTYEFTYLDDTQRKKTEGTWKIDSCFVVLTPSFIPDTIQITKVFETSNKKWAKNVICINELFKGVPKLETNCFLNEKRISLETDTLGNIYYEGEVFDSLSFSIRGRELMVIPTKKDTPSIIQITIDSDCKDLVYKQLGSNKIRILNGKMMIKYKYEEDDTLRTEYFEKI